MPDSSLEPSQPGSPAPPAEDSTQTAPGLSQWQRLSYAFTAPSRTFDDIRRGNKSWWLPFLVAILFIYIFFAVVSIKVGWPQVAENNIRASQKQAERMNEMPADQRARAMKIAAVITESIAFASPVLAIGGALLVSLLLWGTINFGFGGKATYKQVFAVYFYATLPALIKPLLGTLALLVGMAPEAFYLNNYAGTNIAYYLSFEDTNRALYALLTQFDFVNVWLAVLLSIGIATVAGKKRSAGYATVFGWWFIWTAITVIGGLLAG
ncbi:MAG TPA: Yip1 family protein [Terracidiphilus sp.]|nr:Yip1 family protein [Terracidiphilus sp.]